MCLRRNKRIICPLLSNVLKARHKPVATSSARPLSSPRILSIDLRGFYLFNLFPKSEQNKTVKVEMFVFIGAHQMYKCTNMKPFFSQESEN